MPIEYHLAPQKPVFWIKTIYLHPASKHGEWDVMSLRDDGEDDRFAEEGK